MINSAVDRFNCTLEKTPTSSEKIKQINKNTLQGENSFQARRYYYFFCNSSVKHIQIFFCKEKTKRSFLEKKQTNRFTTLQKKKTSSSGV